MNEYRRQLQAEALRFGGGAERPRPFFAAERKPALLGRRCVAALVILFSMALPCALARAEETSAPPDGLKQQSELTISGWQGAKNFSESFPITVSGGSTSGQLRFLCANCTVSPETGTLQDTYTVSVQSAGTYSLTATLSGGNGYAEVSDSRRGFGGKADQAPLSVEGWGTAKAYYRTFAIRVTGGSLNSAITFETDGCTVSPLTGPNNSQFTVTVTRVGTYSLTALMDGDQNHNKAYSAPQSGVACRASQSSIHIDGWDDHASFGDVLSLEISGGLSSEPLVVSGQGCTVASEGSGTYAVTINTVGPYSVAASRAGNYGYNPAYACVSGISQQANQPDVSVSGWMDRQNVSETFSIHIRGGASDGAVHFATSGCTVSPISGTVGDNFFVTVSTVGDYSLIAYVDGTANYSFASSRELKGVAEKAVQPKVAVNNWNDCAVSGSSFDIQLVGGMGTGATSVTTYGGCSAVLKSVDDSNIYTVTVTAKEGEPYGLKVTKLGDANYLAAAETALDGVTAGHDMPQACPLTVNGWKENTQAGESFAIHLEGGNGNNAVSFETAGCTIDPPQGVVDDIYTVTVNAEAGQTYSLSVSSATDGGNQHTSVLKSGSVRPTVRFSQDEPANQDTETPMLGNNYDVWLLLGMVATLMALLSLAVLLQYRDRRRRRRARR